MAEKSTIPSGNSAEDWEIFNKLCKSEIAEEIKMEDRTSEDVDVTTSLRSELAGLQYKRDRLTQEINEMHTKMRSRDQHCLELQIESDQLREQHARQNAIITSLKKRVTELEERERNLFAAQGRSEIALQTAQRDVRLNEEKWKEYETKVRHLEHELSSQQQKKEIARAQLQDFVRRLSVALGADVVDSSSAEALVHKASELVQETARLKNKTHNITDTLGSMEIDYRNCKEHLDRLLNDKEILQRQSANHILELDRLKQEKDAIEMQYRVNERELIELKEKLSISNRSLGSASGNIAQQESLICQLRDELKTKDERNSKLQAELKHILESFAIILSTPSKFIESTELLIKDRIREIITDNKDKTAQIDALKDKLNSESQHLTGQMAVNDQMASRIRNLEDEKSHLETRLHKIETELSSCQSTRDGLKRDKYTFMKFLERLARSLNMEEIANDVGVELHTESLLLRAEQLIRFESDKLVDKNAAVYQLQRRIRTLREQIQRKDLHLDLLRRKLVLQEDNMKTKSLLQAERDEAVDRVKKLAKHIDRLQVQFNESKNQIRELSSQLADAADYKITALERARKIDDLQKRLIESETLRTKYTRKVTLLKDQIRHTGDTIEQERNINEQSLQILRDELTRMKETVADVERRESQLQNFKHSIAKVLGVVLPMPDYELVARLQKLVDAHHDFTLLSRRYDDPVLRLTTRSPTSGGGAGSRCTLRTPDRSRYDDSGYVDGGDLDNCDEDYFKRQGRL